MTRAAACTAALVATLLSAAPALAGTVSVSSTPGGLDNISFNAPGAGEDNQLTVTVNPTSVRFSDVVAITLGFAPGCTQDNATTITCDATIHDLPQIFADVGPLSDQATVNGAPAGPSSAFLLIDLSGDTGDDELTVVGALDVDIFGDDGLDSLTGGDGDDQLVGGSGVDPLLSAGGGRDQVFVDASETGLGGPGDDALQLVTGGSGDGGPGDDLGLFGPASASFDGGAGTDGVILAGASPVGPATVDLEARTASVGGVPHILSGVEDATGLSVNLAGRGSAGPNVLNVDGGLLGLESPDGIADLDGRGGPDVLIGSGLGDAFSSVDGVVDRVSCGGGTDTVSADDIDVLQGCESVSLTVAPSPNDDKAPDCRITKAPKAPTAKAFAKRYQASVTCDEAVTVEGELTVRPGGGLRLARADELTLAVKQSAVGAGEAAKLSLKPRRSLVRGLPDKFKARLAIEALDGAGNRSELSRKISVKKG